MQLRLPAADDDIAHPIRVPHSFAGAARTERVGPDDDGDRLTMARDGDLLASADALKDLGEGRSSSADRDRVRHAGMVHRCTALDNSSQKYLRPTRQAPTVASTVGR